MIPVRDTFVLERAADVRLAVFDVDGVLTDGSLVYGPGGEETKVFNTLDGHGLKMLMSAGIEVAIISGRSSAALALRAQHLGITQLFMGIDSKREVFESLLASLSLHAGQAGGLGDDVIDLPFLSRCRFAACVPASPAYLHDHVHYVTTAAGGHGAAREFCDVILHAQGKLEAAVRRHLD